MTRQSTHVKAHVDRNTGKLIKKKTHLQKLKVKNKRAPPDQKDVYFQEEKCSVCGFLLKNKMMLRMHLRFEHEHDGEIK